MNMSLRLKLEWPVPNSASIQSERGCCPSAIKIIINRKQQKSTNNKNYKQQKRAKSTTLEITLAKGLLHAIAADYNQDEPSFFVRIEP